jgi:hypothetical protein
MKVVIKPDSNDMWLHSTDTRGAMIRMPSCPASSENHSRSSKNLQDYPDWHGREYDSTVFVLRDAQSTFISTRPRILWS